MLVGKNVCHDIRNAQSGIWNGDEYKELFSKYHVKEEKRLHDMLACHEGIAYINGEDTFCEYDTVKPYNEGLCGTMTKWGSTKPRLVTKSHEIKSLEFYRVRITRFLRRKNNEEESIKLQH